MTSHSDPRLYRAFTILSDLAIVIGLILLLVPVLIDLVSPMPLIIGAGIAGAVVITARAAALRYRS